MQLSLVTSSKKTSSSGSNETNLLSRDASSGNSGRLTNVLVITTSVGMVNWVHSDSGNDWEVLSLCLVSPVLNSGLENWLLVSSSGSDDSNHTSGLAVDGLSDTRWQLDSGLESILRMGDDGDERSRGSGELSIVSFSELDVGNESTFWDLTNWQDVTNLKGSLFTAENGLTREHSLDGKVQLLDLLVVISVLELDSGNWGSSAWVVKDFLDDSLDKSVSLLVVQVLVLDFSESSEGVGLVD